jgi:hypothetical protein
MVPAVAVFSSCCRGERFNVGLDVSNSSVLPKRNDPFGCASWTHTLFDTVNLVGAPPFDCPGGGAPTYSKRGAGDTHDDGTLQPLATC